MKIKLKKIVFFSSLIVFLSILTINIKLFLIHKKIEDINVNELILLANADEEEFETSCGTSCPSGFCPDRITIHCEVGQWCVAYYQDRAECCNSQGQVFKVVYCKPCV